MEHLGKTKTVLILFGLTVLMHFAGNYYRGIRGEMATERAVEALDIGGCSRAFIINDEGEAYCEIWDEEYGK